MPLVSIIVPVYNGERFLADALDSALAQTLADTEIVVVDDGSTDGSAAIVDAYAARHPTRFVVVRQANGGICAARNAAIAIARGTYLAMLDADDIWMPHHLLACTSILESRADVGLVHANIQRFDAADTMRQTVKRFWDRTDLDTFATIYLRREHVSCSTVVVRREVIERVGGFDLAFNRLGAEDRDLWLRCALVVGFVFLDDVHARYRMHGGNVSRDIERMHRARILLIEKFGAQPRAKPMRRRAMAAAYAGLGAELLEIGRRAAGARAYLNALRYYPIELRTWKALARCVLVPRKLAEPATIRNRP